MKGIKKFSIINCKGEITNNNKLKIMSQDRRGKKK